LLHLGPEHGLLAGVGTIPKAGSELVSFGRGSGAQLRLIERKQQRVFLATAPAAVRGDLATPSWIYFIFVMDAMSR
jgi:hypothetical protein